MRTSKEKSETYQKQSGDIELILSDLIKGVETVISSLQRIAKQRPNSGQSHLVAGQPSSSVKLSSDEVEAEDREHNKFKRNEKLRSMIDFNPPADILGTPGVTESNLIQYLGLIEQKANELLTLNYVVNSHKKVIQLGDQDGVLIPAGGVAGLLGQGPAAPVGTLSIVAPSTAYDFLSIF